MNKDGIIIIQVGGDSIFNLLVYEFVNKIKNQNRDDISLVFYDWDVIFNKEADVEAKALYPFIVIKKKVEEDIVLPRLSKQEILRIRNKID